MNRSSSGAVSLHASGKVKSSPSMMNLAAQASSSLSPQSAMEAELNALRSQVRLLSSKNKKKKKDAERRRKTLMRRKERRRRRKEYDRSRWAREAREEENFPSHSFLWFALDMLMIEQENSHRRDNSTSGDRSTRDLSASHRRSGSFAAYNGDWVRIGSNGGVSLPADSANSSSAGSGANTPPLLNRSRSSSIQNASGSVTITLLFFSYLLTSSSSSFCL